MRSPGDLENSLHSDVKKSKNRHLVIINQLRKKVTSSNSLIVIPILGRHLGWPFPLAKHS